MFIKLEDASKAVDTIIKYCDNFDLDFEQLTKNPLSWEEFSQLKEDSNHVRAI